MKEHTNYRVAYSLGENFECESVMLIKVVDQRTLNEMRNQVEKRKQKELEKEQLVASLIKSLQEKCSELEHEIKVLKGEDE